MPVIVAWIGEMLVSVVGQMVLSALLSVGIGFIASKVGSGVIDHTEMMADMKATGLSNWVSYLRIDQDITIILSAWAGRALTNGLRAHLAAIPAKASAGSAE